jgi:signal peptidase I
MLRSFLNIVKEYLSIILLAVGVAFLTKVFVLDAVYVPSGSMEGTLLRGDYVLVNKLLYGATTPKHLPLLQSGLPFIQFPGLRSVRRGDVIVFEFPEERADKELSLPRYFVKRCVGLPGDEISLQRGNIVVNGTMLNIPNTNNITRGDFEQVRVPKKGDVVELSRQNYSMWKSLIQQEGHTTEIHGDGEIFIDGAAASNYTIAKNYLFVLGDNLDHSFDSRAWGFLPEENVVGNAMMVYWSANPSRAHDESENFFSAIRWDRLGNFVR